MMTTNLDGGKVKIDNERLKLEDANTAHGGHLIWTQATSASGSYTFRRWFWTKSHEYVASELSANNGATD